MRYLESRYSKIDVVQQMFVILIVIVLHGSQRHIKATCKGQIDCNEP